MADSASFVERSADVQSPKVSFRTAGLPAPVMRIPAAGVCKGKSPSFALDAAGASARRVLRQKFMSSGTYLFASCWY